MDLCSSKSVTDIMSYPAVECLLFDLNDTLYSTTETGIDDTIVKNIEAFLVEKCGIAEEKAPSMCNELYIKYGTTLAGLKALGYDIDDEDFHKFVQERMPSPYELIKPNPQLRNLLLSIKQRKILFTNSRRNHAIKILESIGLQDCFDQMITFETLNANLLLLSKADRRLGVFPVIMKPSVEAMKIALDVVQVVPRRVFLLDNDERNIAIGKAVGFRTVLVGGNPVKCTTEADYWVEDLTNDLRSLIPELWENGTNN